MAIRFQCSSCMQPIEVDDELARMAVVCPYCRRTITTPAESTLPDPAELPLARGGTMPQQPVAGPEGASWPTGPTASQPPGAWPGTPSPMAGAPPLRPPVNRVAGAAVLVACLSLATCIVFAWTFRSHREDLTKYIEPGADPSQGFQAANKLIEDNGGVPPAWLMTSSFSMLLTAALWFTAMVLAIIGLTRSHRRGRAGWAMGICFLTIVLGCLGLG